MEGGVAPNIGEVTSTGSQGFQPEMNLRSVFTAEQQRTLLRYYENGMTNQSKSCFQLILQCAQETKLDFSVVRTWVGNKRRKMSSKIYESGTMLKPPMSGSPSHTSEGGPSRTTPTLPRVPPPAPPQRSSSDHDVILTNVYSPSGSSARQGGGPQTSAASDLQKPAIPRPAVRSEVEFVKLQPPQPNPAPLMDEKAAMLSRQPGPSHHPNPFYIKKTIGGPQSQIMERMAPQKTLLWPHNPMYDRTNTQRPNKNDQPSVSAAHHGAPPPRNQNFSPGLQKLEIKEVFSLAANSLPPRHVPAAGPRPGDSNCFSISMETGDVDEYTREEELASMVAPHNICTRFKECSSSPHTESQCRLSPVAARTGSAAKLLPPGNRDAPENTAYHNKNEYYMPLNTSIHNTNISPYTTGNVNRNNAHRHYNVHPPPQGALLPGQNNYQISGSLSVPWITECSRKRTLQDRTQFSDHDLAALKKYWDNGMTSLGSVCREKIEAVATELNVDCEIVRTWIGNRRRKYRLMGIEVPPPRGGPPTFPDHPDPAHPTEDPVAGVGEESDHHDVISICLSEDSSQADDMLEAGRGDELMMKADSPDGAPVHSVKVEAPEEELTASKMDVEKLRSLLEYKNEDIRYMKVELEDYKQKYAELQAFTRALLCAIRANDAEQQQMLLNDAPPELEDMEYSQESPECQDTSQSMASAPERNHPEELTHLPTYPTPDTISTPCGAPGAQWTDKPHL